MRADRPETVPLAALVTGAALLGVLHFALFFTDRANESSAWTGIAWSAALASVSGFLGGLLRPSAWWSVALLGAWGAPVWGAISLAMGSPRGIAILVLPAGTGLVSAWIAPRFRPGQAGDFGTAR